MITNEYGLEKRQRELLKMLQDIDVILSENNISYSLCGGSLLGAVRHNGFIPWDDDIDIMMNRENYCALINLFDREKEIISPDRASDTIYFLHRVLWIYRIQKKRDINKGMMVPTIDVFVMDNCPNNRIVRAMKVIMIQALQGMMKKEVEYENKTAFYKICLFVTHEIGRLMSDEKKFAIYDKVSQLGNNRHSTYLTGYNDLFKLLKTKYSSNLLDHIIKHPFEDLNIPITAEYDSYLTAQYGDYMTPPPRENRISMHI